MTALMISQIKVLNPEKFKEYLDLSKEIASRYGAALVTRARLEKTLNRKNVPQDLVVMARFPDIQAIQSWYDDEAYKAIVSLREEASEQAISVYEEI